jgi:hypothetical protein
MDILYYSNYCPNCKKILKFIASAGLIEKINAICIDKRITNPNTGQINIVLENGRKILLPPNVHGVPALLIVSQKYSAIFGDEIMQYFGPYVKNKQVEATGIVGEPVGITLGQPSAGNILSEQYTFYDMTPEELSAKGSGSGRQMGAYVSASHDNFSIQTPIDTYRPDKVGESVSIESLENARNKDVPQVQANPYGFT